MKILHLSDIHGQVENFSLVEEHIHTCKLIVVTGDLTHLGDQMAMSRILQYLPLDKTLAVLGNCDYPTTLKTLLTAGINLDGEKKEVAGYHLCGYGGSLPTPICTPNMHSETEFQQTLARFVAPDILVTHQPAFGTEADLTLDGTHTGSTAILRYIQQQTPRLALCGHMHEAQSLCMVGDTVVVNSGALAMGHYAIIHLTRDNIKVTLK